MTAKECTKKRDARAELLFGQSKPSLVLPFSLTSPSSLLELNNNNDGDNAAAAAAAAAADDDDDDGSGGGGGDNKRIELSILTVARYRYFRRVRSSLH